MRSPDRDDATLSVSPRRVARFAVRQSLTLTEANRPLVVAYLATTRRWRGAGLVVSILASVVIGSLFTGRTNLTLVSLFIGWFVGAIVAEWRVSAPTRTPGRQRAVLAPRTDRDYLSTVLRYATRVVVIVTLVVAGVGQAFTSRHLLLLVLTAVVVLATATVWAASRRVLVRPQPTGRSDVRAADEAIRSRSLHVLHGVLLTICGYVGTAAGELGLAAPHHRLSVGHELPATVGLIVMAGGLIVAVTPRKPPRRLAARPTPGPMAAT